MDEARLLLLVAEGESQTLEFKQSLSSGAQREAIESLVAFANTEGGRVLLGVQNDGTVRGVQIGMDTLERLANKIRQHTYPSLPATIETAKDGSGKDVVAVETPKDRPPVIGVYMYSQKPIGPDEQVDASRLQAYRRVGRTNQKEDFMWLRSALPSDPKVRLTVESVGLGRDSSEFWVWGYVWMQEGSATAHQLSFRLDPPVGQSDTTYTDLPFARLGQLSGSETEEVVRSVGEFSCKCDRLNKLVGSRIRFIARYRDDWGLTWETSRKYEVVMRQSESRKGLALDDRNEFRRRIVGVPEKVVVP